MCHVSAAADEITRDLAPGSVELRLRGRDPSFVVTSPPVESLEPSAEDTAATADALHRSHRDQRLELPSSGKRTTQRLTGWVR